MSLWYYILLFGTAFGGGLLVFLLPATRKQHLQLILSFSGAYLFAVTLLHLIPETYEVLSYQAGLYVLAGFFLQLILEQFSKGVEHGHIHMPHGNPRSYLTGVVLGLSVHAFVEGMPLGSGVEHLGLTQRFLAGIILHKVPAAFALAAILVGSGVKKQWVVAFCAIFAAMSPLGALTGDGLAIHFDKILAVVIGSFLHISTTILFESESEAHKFNILKIMAILAGVVIALFTI